jgi:hypothetical protein
VEINIVEINSEVRAMDSASLLAPEMLERIVRLTIERLHEEEAHRQRAETERALCPGISGS